MKLTEWILVICSCCCCFFLIDVDRQSLNCCANWLKVIKHTIYDKLQHIKLNHHFRNRSWHVQITGCQWRTDADSTHVAQNGKTNYIVMCDSIHIRRFIFFFCFRMNVRVRLERETLYVHMKVCGWIQTKIRVAIMSLQLFQRMLPSRASHFVMETLLLLWLQFNMPVTVHSMNFEPCKNNRFAKNALLISGCFLMPLSRSFCHFISFIHCAERNLIWNDSVSINPPISVIQSHAARGEEKNSQDELQAVGKK